MYEILRCVSATLPICSLLSADVGGWLFVPVLLFAYEKVFRDLGGFIEKRAEGCSRRDNSLRLTTAMESSLNIGGLAASLWSLPIIDWDGDYLDPFWIQARYTAVVALFCLGRIFVFWVCYV